MKKSVHSQNIIEKTRILILDNIRSVYNVGSIFRTADAVGINKIYLIGTSPTPLDRFGRNRKDLAKVALGAEKTIDWEYVKNDDCLELLKDMKEQNIILISAEQDENSDDFKKLSEKIEKKNKIALILGNEVCGVSKEIIKQSNYIVEIPMKGKKESLNVSVSAGIVMFELFG